MPVESLNLGEQIPASFSFRVFRRTLFPFFSFCRYNEPTCEEALHISRPVIQCANQGLRYGQQLATDWPPRRGPKS